MASKTSIISNDTQRHQERRGFPRRPEREGVPLLNLITLSSTD